MHRTLVIVSLSWNALSMGATESLHDRFAHPSKQPYFNQLFPNTEPRGLLCNSTFAARMMTAVRFKGRWRSSIPMGLSHRLSTMERTITLSFPFQKNGTCRGKLTSIGKSPKEHPVESTAYAVDGSMRIWSLRSPKCVAQDAEQITTSARNAMRSSIGLGAIAEKDDQTFVIESPAMIGLTTKSSSRCKTRFLGSSIPKQT